MLTAQDLMDWAVYSQLEPFGFPADDARMSILAATELAAAGVEDVTPEDFSMAASMASKIEDADEQQKAKNFAKALAKAIGAVEVPHEEPNA